MLDNSFFIFNHSWDNTANLCTRLWCVLPLVEECAINSNMLEDSFQCKKTSINVRLDFTVNK